jgi:phenylalanine-4-hydroxylase
MKKREILTLVDGKQVHKNYTEEDRNVWKLLFNNQMEALPGRASTEFMEGISVVNFTADAIPDFNEVNAILQERTGWEVVPVEGIVDDRLFFELMSQRKFPATTWLRTMEQLEYLEEPDMFHDVFAHVPLLANAPFADFLESISKIGMRYASDEKAVDLLSRLYWYTVEFGLIRENNSLRIYGAGILSSSGESRYSLGIEPMHFEYNVEQILNTPYRKDVFQDRYYIIESFEKLFESTSEIEIHMEEMLSKRLRLA